MTCAPTLLLDEAVMWDDDDRVARTVWEIYTWVEMCRYVSIRAYVYSLCVKAQIDVIAFIAAGRDVLIISYCRSVQYALLDTRAASIGQLSTTKTANLIYGQYAR